MAKKPLDSREFFKLLNGRTRHNAERVDRAIRERSEREVTIFACDTAGFTRKTHEYGIQQFLSVMTRGFRSLSPIFKKCRGAVVSQHADNLIAVFTDARSAVRAAVEIQRKLKHTNRGKHDSDQFHLSIGIETGPCCVLRDNVYGATVNIASKVGEDLAGKGQILVTAGVAKAVRPQYRASYDRSLEIGGRLFELYRVSY